MEENLDSKTFRMILGFGTGAVAISFLIQAATNLISKLFNASNYVGSNSQMLIALILFVVFTISWLVRNIKKIKSNLIVKRFTDILLFIPYNISILLFGNIERELIQKETHSAILALQKSTLFGRIADLNKNDRQVNHYHLIYTHNGDHSPTSLYSETYERPGYPKDEAALMDRLWHFAASNLSVNWSNIRPRCSCIPLKSEDGKIILNGSSALIGSSKNNNYTDILTRKLKNLFTDDKITSDHSYILEIDKNNNCYLKSLKVNHVHLFPDESPTQNLDDELTDYGIIMKLPNILGNTINFEHSIMLFAGCKVASQFGMTKWISETKNLEFIFNKFSHHYFYILFKVKYKFVYDKLPEIIEFDICKDTRNGKIQDILGRMTFS